jgi:hypothetical protein
MQAGLVSRKLTFRDIFTCGPKRLLLVVVFVGHRDSPEAMRHASRAA